ncbi:MAG: ribosomal-processing cysteine protease Prp [Oscillospiraceae bacterium]|nr:ribosomal-processing cysteine protease Prp [Oscillospiraceae bacterium]
MTTANFCAQDGRLTGFSVEGHSGLAPEGEDVLCAAVTSAVRLTECAVNDVLGLECPVKIRRKDALISLKLPARLERENEALCQTLLEALMLYFCQLHEEYPEHFTVFHHESMEV